TSADKERRHPPGHEPPPSPSTPPPSPPPPQSPPPPPPASPPPSPSPPPTTFSPPPPPSPPPPHSPPPPTPGLPPPHTTPAPPPKHPHPHPPPKRVPLSLAVNGVVLCQSCFNVGTKSLIGAIPLKGVKVGLVGKNGRYKSYSGKSGRFSFFMGYFDFRRYDPVKSCRVLLISSSSGYCSRKTFINYSRFGAMLRFDGRARGIMFYSVRPLAFAPSRPCYRAKPKPKH
ncbi:hypothetical protein KP509_36G064300, partial [Ceratopteris richardii]